MLSQPRHPCSSASPKRLLLVSPLGRCFCTNYICNLYFQKSYSSVNEPADDRTLIGFAQLHHQLLATYSFRLIFKTTIIERTLGLLAPGRPFCLILNRNTFDTVRRNACINKFYGFIARVLSLNQCASTFTVGAQNTNSCEIRSFRANLAILSSHSQRAGGISWWVLGYLGFASGQQLTGVCPQSWITSQLMLCSCFLLETSIDQF